MYTRGIPKYLEGKDPMLNPKFLARKALVVVGVLKNNIFAILLLIIVLEMCMKSCKMGFNSMASLRETWYNNIMSSTNFWWVRGRSLPQI